MKISSVDAVSGTLIGLVAGDRNGGPTQMALRLAESLVDQKKFDLSDVSSRYLQWWSEGAFDTGPITDGVLEQVYYGLSFEEASKAVHESSGGYTAGCNAAHRIAPLAMCRDVSDRRLEQEAKKEAMLTHWHPLAGDASAAVACLCRQLILGKSWRESIEIAGKRRLDETFTALNIKDDVELNRGGFSPDTLAAAIYFVGSSKKFDEALERSMAFAGRANYCPVLVGAIGGARWGKHAVIDSALSHVDEFLLVRVQSAAKDLAADW